MQTFRDSDKLDPRRRQRGLRTRDFASASRAVSIPSLPELLASLAARFGLLR